MPIGILFLQKVMLATLIGALLGMEREYSKRQEIAGVRTFALVALLGCLSVIASEKLGTPLLILLCFVFVCLFAIALYINSMLKHRAFGFTSNISLMMTCVLGILVGFEYFVEAVFLAIVVAIILFSKERLHQFVSHLNEREVGDLLEFLVLLGIVYPILPESITVYGIVFPLLTIWLLIVAVSLINFVAFIGARYMCAKYEISALSFLTGLISLTVTATSHAPLCKQNRRLIPVMVAGFMLACAAMFLRNYGIVIFGAPGRMEFFLPTLAAGFIGFAGLSFLMFRGKSRRQHLKISSPFNVAAAVKLGLLVLVLFTVLDVVKGVSAGLVFLAAFVGGLVNSQAVAVSLAGLLGTGMLDPMTASIATFMTCASSVIRGLVIYTITGCKDIARKSLLGSAIGVAIAAAAAAATVLLLG